MLRPQDHVRCQKSREQVIILEIIKRGIDLMVSPFLFFVFYTIFVRLNQMS